MRIIKDQIGKSILFIILLNYCSFLKAQDVDYGYTLGMSFSFGSHVNRLGVTTGGYLSYGPAQVNATMKLFYDFQSFGLKKKTPELQLGIGGIIGFGRRDTTLNSFIGIAENNTVHDYAVGYSFINYKDRLGTSQSTGIVHGHIKQLSVLMENDLFGNFIHQEDRYRTGAFAVEYQFGLTKVGVSALIWTHDYKNCSVFNNEETKEWSRFGYYLDEEVENRKESLGIINVYGRQWLPYKQELKLGLGLNGEKIRNGIQNKLIHDQPIMPEKLIWRKPSHIPMITTENKQFLYKDGQEIKPLEFYFNVSANSLPFF